MKVLHLATSLSGGAGIATQRLHQALQVKGVDSRVVHAPHGGCSARRADTSVAPRFKASAGVRILRRLGLWQSARARSEQRFAQLRNSDGPPPRVELFSPPFADFCPEQHAWFQEADIVHLHWTSGLLDWPRLAETAPKPLVISLHDQEPYLGCVHYQGDLDRNPGLGEMDADFRVLKQRVFQNRPLGVLGHSQWNTHLAQTSGAFPSTGVHWDTVYYPLDCTQYSPHEAKASRTAFEIAPDRLVVGFACDKLDSPRKGIRVMLQALNQLPLVLQERLQLLSFGRDPDDSTIADCPWPWIHLGPQNQAVVKAMAYRAMDVMVVPSLEEAFGQTAIEAIACGTTTIASDSGGLTEALHHGEAGLLVPADNPAALAERITEVLQDTTTRETFTADARQLIATRHDAASIGDQLHKFYAQLLQAH